MHVPQSLGKPLLFCDVDGVLSLWGGLDVRLSDDIVWAQVEGILHALSRGALANLARCSELFEVIWATGWEEKADPHLRPLLAQHRVPPLPRWRHLELDAARGAGLTVAGHWKLGAIDAAAGPDRPLAFVDDVLDERCRVWAAGRRAPTLLVQTDPATGLDAAALARLEAFAGGLDSGG
jgi:hypothetical protein